MHPASFPHACFARWYALARDSARARAGDRVVAAPSSRFHEIMHPPGTTDCACRGFICHDARFLFRNRTLDRRLSMLVDGEAGKKRKEREGNRAVTDRRKKLGG